MRVRVNESPVMWGVIEINEMPDPGTEDGSDLVEEHLDLLLDLAVPANANTERTTYHIASLGTAVCPGGYKAGPRFLKAKLAHFQEWGLCQHCPPTIKPLSIPPTQYCSECAARQIIAG